MVGTATTAADASAKATPPRSPENHSISRTILDRGSSRNLPTRVVWCVATSRKARKTMRTERQTEKTGDYNKTRRDSWLVLWSYRLTTAEQMPTLATRPIKHPTRMRKLRPG